MKKIIPVFIVVLLVVAGGSFYGGMAYGKTKSAVSGPKNFGEMNGMPQNMNINGRSFRGGPSGDSGGGMNIGQIISKDSSSITIKTQTGSTKIILYSASTTITKNVTGTADDLVVGQNVSANGTANQDGSLTATSIQLITASLIQ